MNDRLLGLHAEAHLSGARDVAQRGGEAAAVLKERATALSALMERDARQALSLAFSPDLLAELAAKFPESVSDLESHGTWQGPVEYWIADDADLRRHRAVRRMAAGGESLEIHFAGPEPAGLKSGDILAMTGVRVGAAVAAAEAAIEGTTVSAASCSPTGVQNTAVLLVTWADATVPPTLTPPAVYDTFFGTAGRSLDGFWREASYGKTFAAGDVFGWYALDTPYTCAQASQMRDAAIARAAADGANFQNYTRVFVIYPNIGCTAGFAQVGCSTLSAPSGSFTASSAYIEADYMGGDQGVQLATHEGGHNLGLLHSGTLGFGTEVLGPLGAAGTVNEFGDYWSTMGSQALGIYPAPHKAEVLSWMASGVNYQIVESSGTWSLQPLETSPAGLQALKIRRGTGNDAWLWVEYRQPNGNYDSTLMTQPFSGALIHYQDPSTGAVTRLLDFTPDLSWNTWWDPALVAGSRWVDPYTNLSISVQSATSSALTVNVTYGPMPCTHANPAVSASPPNASTYPGSGVSYNVSVTNNDSAGCSASTFTLSSSQPSGWSTAFSAASLTLSPGQSGLVTMTKTAPAGAAAGTYAVNANAANGTMVGAGSANCTVMASLSATLSLPKSSYTARQTVPMTATVTGPGATTASVALTLMKPNGASATKKVQADATGKALWNYNLGPKDPPGPYSAVAVAVSGKNNARSNVVSFTVQ